jgi:hypothetical protein
MKCNKPAIVLIVNQQQYKNKKKFYAKNQKGINQLPQRTKQMMYLTKNYTQVSS